MHTFEQTMAEGQADYQDVIKALGRAGYPTTFTQTGGMNAALQVALEGGWQLLITDADDSLSWDRGLQNGWGVMLFAPDDVFDGPCLTADTTADTSTDALIELVQRVLRVGASAR